MVEGRVQEMSNLIDRKKVIDAICLDRCCISTMDRCEKNDEYCELVEYILNIPVEKLKRQTGEWEEVDITVRESELVNILSCSRCHFWLVEPKKHFNVYHFCPNCGAKMKYEKEPEKPTIMQSINLLRRMQNPEEWEPAITRDDWYALEAAINALEKQT
jgi:hypothetical protein